MPRRTLLVITALVLALHGWVLSGVPLAWKPSGQPHHPTDRVFNTRSITAPPPAPAAAAPEAPPPPVAAPRPPARKKPPSPQGTPAQAAPAPSPVAPPEAPSEAPAEASPEVAVASAAAEAAGTEPPQTALPAVPASAAAPAQDSQPATGVDIRPPGGTSQGDSAAPPPVRIPAPARLAFDVSGQAKRFAYSARAELLWQHDGSRYEARQEVSAFLVGSRTQSSVGQITPQGLRPERFSDRARSEQAAHFDHAQGRVTFSANTPEAAVGPGAQDRLGLFIQLGALLAADPGRFKPGTQITLTTVSARSADRWTFTVEGPETLDLPAGLTPALKLQRLPRKDYDQKAELWLAPALGYLPVRIKLTQANGDFADLQLRSSSAP